MAAPRKPVTLRVVVGRNSHTHVVHRLTFTDDGLVKIERQPYVSPHPDGWQKTYESLIEPANLHGWLIDDIERHPCEWSARRGGGGGAGEVGNENE